jgi:hypothetical protein
MIGENPNAFLHGLRLQLSGTAFDRQSFRGSIFLIVAAKPESNRGSNEGIGGTKKVLI